MRIGDFDFVTVVEATDIVINGNFSQGQALHIFTDSICSILYDKPIIHFSETVHIPGNIILDVLDAAYFEDHEFVDRVPDGKLSARLDVR